MSVKNKMVNDKWRRWIADNLLLGNDPASMHATMLAAGIASNDAQHEINVALTSTYLDCVERLRDRLTKRNRLLESVSKLKRLHPGARDVERRRCLSRSDFLREFYSQNRAVVITDMLDQWPAMQKWNLDYFVRVTGERAVEVQFGRSGDPNFEVNREKMKRTMLLEQYVEILRSADASNDFYLTVNNQGSNSEAFRELWQDTLSIPEYLDNDKPNLGHFWLKPPGTLTPFHYDLTNHFLVQVIGIQCILLISASESQRTYYRLHCDTSVDGRHIDFENVPALHDAIIQTVCLHPGEILFLPVGHWHSIETHDISCGMSFTNFIFDNDFISFYNIHNEV
jgi:hypothetical protein